MSNQRESKDTKNIRIRGTHTTRTQAYPIRNTRRTHTRKPKAHRYEPNEIG